MNNLPVVRSPWRIAILTVGFTFLYAPMLMLVIYSFNSSKLVTVWAGWSTRWYSELFHDSAMISAMGHAFGWPSERGMFTIWLAHVTFCTAYVAVVISSRLREVDRSIEEAAMDLGAPPLKVFFVITLPMIAPALISGWMLAFTLSLDDLVIASFVSGPGATTLPMLVFSSVRMGVNPEINALASLILLVVGILGLIAWWFMARSEKQRSRELQRAARS
ncbi:ABC transporter permease subunit [Serratia nematodiphila]